MADLFSYGNAERDIEQALISLKKGAQLLKYGRKGKPKFCPFRLSHDETALIWISSKSERILKLSTVSRIVAGQRTAVFQRYLRPDKDYLSFSLIYDNGKRSLDVICKEKVEAEVWIAGLRALIASGQSGRSKIDGWSDGGLYDLISSNSPTDSSVSASQPSEISFSPNTNTTNSETNMQVKGSSSSDVLRVSVSSAPSTSSHGSGADDCDAFGDVYIWGEVICDNNTKGGDVLVPRPLESSIVLDVHHIACGVKHAALVTRQGEVFTWGEESGGRLGHGVCKDVNEPRFVESLSSSNVDLVSCGEFHTCAVTMSGEIYTWGDGTHNAGLLGHGSDVSHWIPKRILGPLEGVQIATVSCGPWHTGLVTSSGQLFTFGDGTFGVLGHGDRENVLYPKEVESLSGLRTIGVSCGVWHTAAIVEVIVTSSSSSTSSGKLFTWGDGDKNRLGHVDKEPRLKPTCVSSLIDFNFYKIACGHSLTVGLTTSGQVFTMGSSVYGQLGSQNSDGKLPCLVEDKLVGEIVEDIACGAYHVTVLTSKNEVYTWGKGANGRLGHGDVQDRKTPTKVEALKDRHVKNISCGSNYTAAICLHKWVSGAEQSQCSSCRQLFGFTRKRHNCYNCGLVHCHSCTSKKAIRAALAPNPSKPYRVCDTCFAKLTKIRLSAENKDNNFELIIKQLDNKAAAKQGKKNSEPPLFIRPRSISPFSSPPRSTTPPLPTISSLSFSKTITDSLNHTNDLLNQQVNKLRAQVASLKHRCELQEKELRKSAEKAEEAIALAAEESAKSKAAKEVIKSLTAQLKDMAERLPPVTNTNTNTNTQTFDVTEEHCTRSDSINHSYSEDAENGFKSKSSSVAVVNADQVEAEWIEQYEPGVYITLVALRDGTRDLKRVRFSRRRFGENQAQTWWSENREKVYDKHNIRGGSDQPQPPRTSEGSVSPIYSTLVP